MLTVDNFDTSDIKKWKSEYIPEMGTVGWRHPHITILVFATPSFEMDDETPVELYDERSGEISEFCTWIHKRGTDEEKNRFVRASLKSLFDYIEEGKVVMYE